MRLRQRRRALRFLQPNPFQSQEEVRTLLSSQPVPIPEVKGIFTKKAGRQQECYVYKRTQYYRNDKGQPSSRSVCIGKVCPEDPARMIPNEKYFSLYGTPSESSPPQKEDPLLDYYSEYRSTLHYGYTFVLFQTAEDIGLVDVLASSLGEDTALDLVAIAAYLLYEGSSLEAMEEWQERTYLPYESRTFTASRLTSLLQLLTDDVRTEILARWVAQNQDPDCMCWETAARDSELSYGIPGDPGKRRPRHYLVLFASLSAGRLLTYSTSYESIQDPAALSRAIADAENLGLAAPHLFTDTRCFSGKGFAACRNAAKSFTVSMPPEDRKSKAFIDAVLPVIQEAGNRLVAWHLQCAEVSGAVYQTEGRVLVFYDQEEASVQNRRMDEEICWLLDAAERKQPRANSMEYRKYFQRKSREDGGTELVIDSEKVGALMRYHGFTLSYTTNQALTPAEILDRYQLQDDVAEELLPRGEPLLPGRRDKLRFPNPEAVDQFLAFLSAILGRELQIRLKHLLQGESLYLRTVLSRLNSIVVACGDRGIRLQRGLTREQREILDALGQTDRLLASIALLHYRGL